MRIPSFKPWIDGIIDEEVKDGKKPRRDFVDKTFFQSMEIGDNGEYGQTAQINVMEPGAEYEIVTSQGRRTTAVTAFSKKKHKSEILNLNPAALDRVLVRFEF